MSAAWFVVGFFAGGFCGVMVLALCMAAKGDR